MATITIVNEKEIERMKFIGFEFYEGVTPAYKDNQKGVVNEQGEFFPIVPLNGWRARNLAEEVFGRRSANELYIGRAFAVPARTLQELPGFDSHNQEIVNQYHGIVLVQVVEVDPSYGCYIRIVQA